MANTPYDDVFRTLLNDCPKLVLPVVNEVFHEHYTGNEVIVFSPNEHFLNRQGGEELERITDTCFVVQAAAAKQYHLECQSTPDNSMLVRMFEYGAQIALDGSEIKEGVLEVEFPQAAVLFLRHNGATPDMMRIKIITPGGELGYQIPVLKLQEYALVEIFEKGLLFLLPFYIFVHESRFEQYTQGSQELERLWKEYAYIRGRLEELCSQGKIDEYTKCTLIDMCNKVVDNLAANYDKVREGVKEIMGGKLLDYEAKRIKVESYEKGISQGRQQILIELVHDGIMTEEDAAGRMCRSVEEFKRLL